MSRLLFALLISACCLTAFGADQEEASEGESAAPSASPAPVSPQASGTANQEPAAQPLPPRNFGEPTVEVPYSSLFRNTAVTTTSASAHPEINPAVRTDSFDFQSDFGLRGLGLQLPFAHRGFEPKDATLKLGPVFIKVRELQGAVLASDNIHLSETDRQAGVIAVMRLDLGIILQLGENLQLAVAGAFVYLPLQGKFGPAGYGLSSALGLSTEPVIRSQMTYDTMIGGWEVVFFDEVSIGVVNFVNDVRTSIDAFQGASFPWVDRAGVYAFGSPYSSNNGQSNFNYRFNPTVDQQYLSNTVGFKATHMLPSDIRLSVRAIQQNLWYNTNGRGMPSSRQEVSIRGESVRENLRFKPFLEYRADHLEPGNTFSQTILGGAIGPITDQLNFYGGIGDFLDSNGHQDLLWDLRFRHDAGPNTKESLIFGRNTNLFDQILSTHAMYTISQVLGPSLTGDLYVRAEKVEDLNVANNSFNNFVAGIRLRQYVSPRTEMQLAGTYQYQTYTNPNEYLNVWTGQFVMHYHFTSTWIAHLLYQYQNRQTNRSGFNYYENLVTLSISKFFP